ncbi:MAG TPA: electron transport complex subunit E [Candidatus Krumholzibacteria bacterium]|nr:electron transport complex subunit E [Candidatus Krumholzibacteria bacterium]HPD72654.1 electron transport complex subunit E [Candidatus Krumholzibacteria bacterium]HRY40414.1 electron transport complex subunit E [Candidatus Krumholzibacteria bacterium]
MTAVRALTHGFWRNLPPFRLVLGLCPALAITTAAEYGLGMGLAVTFVLVFSNALVSLLRRVIPDEVRIASFIVVIATLVVLVELAMKAYFYPLSRTLGIYVPLIVVNCIILGRAEAFASRNPVLVSAADGLGVGLGYTISLIVVGSLREILGAGTWFGRPVFGDGFEPFGFMVKAPGAFLCLGLLLGVMNAWSRRRGEIFVQT